MNPTNCSGFTVTDTIFQERPIGSCGSSLVGYVLVSTGCCLVGLVATLKRWKDYYARKRKGLKASKLNAFLFVGALVSHVITLVLAGTNVINASNGYSFVAVAFTFAFNALNFLVAYDRTVKAGSRMVRVSAKDQNLSSNGDAKELDKVDKRGSFGVLFGSICGILGSLTLSIFSPLFPDKQSMIGLIGWNLEAGFHLAITGALIWQLQRCVVFLQRLEADGASKTVVRAITKRIRIRQLSNVAKGFFNTIYLILLAVQVVPWEWWSVLGIQIFLDAASAVLVAFTTRAEQLSTMGRKKSSLFFKDPAYRAKPRLFKELGMSGFLGVDDMERLPSRADVLDRTYRFMEGEMQIGCETLVHRIWGKKAALQAAKFTENTFITLLVALYGIAHVCLAQCHFIMLEACIPMELLYPWSLIGLLLNGLVAATRISLPIAGQVLKTPSFWIRFLTIVILFLCMLDVVGFDERSLTVTITTLLTSLCLFMDALIVNSSLYRVMVYCLVVPLPIINLFFLQFDIIANRRNTIIPLVQTGSFNYSWSVYQMALDSNYSLFFILLRDAFKALRRSEYFIYLEAPIYAHIKPMEGVRPTSMMVNTQDLHFALNHGGIVVSGDQGAHYVDRIVLREDDAIAVHVLGKERVKIWFAFWGNVYVRSITKILVGVTFLTCTIGAFPEVWPKEAVLAEIYTLLVLLVAVASFKSWTMLKLLMRRLDFWIDAFLVALVFVAGAVVFAGDVRMFTFILCFISFLDERTFDARVVIFSNPKRSFGGIVLVISLVFLLCSILSLVVVFNLGFVSSINKEAAIVFRSVDDTSPMAPPSGTFARLRLIQFAANGLTAFAMYQGLQQLSNFWRSKEDGIRLQWLSAPIQKRYVKFADTGNPVAIRQSTAFHRTGFDHRSTSNTDLEVALSAMSSQVVFEEEDSASPVAMARVPSLQEMPMPSEDRPGTTET